MADGKIVIDTDIDDKGVKTGLNKLKSLAGGVAKGVGVAAGAIGGALVSAIGSAVKQAGELEQQIGGTTAVFGDLAEIVQNKAVKAFDQMGVSANDYMQTANKMASLMQGAGLSVEDSMTLSTDAMQRAADVASVMGISTESAMESIAGAAKGNFTMMDNLGVAMNATTIEAYALSKGITTSYNEMDNATKVGLAMQMFMEKTSKYAGNYANENKTFAGSFTTLKASIKNFMSGAGSITDVSNAMVQFGTILVDSIVNMAPQIINGIVELVQNLIPQIPPLLEQLLPPLIEGTVAIIQGLATVLPMIIDEIIKLLPQIIDAGIQIIIALIKGIAESLPTMIPTIVDAILTIVDTIIDNIDLIVDAGIEIILALIEGLIDATPKLIDKLPDLIIKIATKIIENLPKILEAGKKILKKLIDGIFEGAANLFKKIGELINDYIIQPIKDKIKKFLDIGKNIVEGIWNGISNGFTWIKNKITGWVNDVLDFIKKLFGIASPSKKTAVFGKYLAQGLGVGFDKEIDNVYDKMQDAIDLENSKVQANLQTGNVYNKVFNTTPIDINNNNTTVIEADGEVLTRVVNRTNEKRSLQYGF